MSIVQTPPSLTQDHALFLDFDGTLAPIQDDPDTVCLPDGLGEVIVGLQDRLGEAVVIISGRDIRDLSSRVPGDVWRAGGHGLEICAPGESPADLQQPAPPALTHALDAIVHGLDGVRLEPKGPVIAIHYRKAPHLGPSLESRLKDAIAGIDGYKLQSGKMVFETKPESANKGKAVERMMQHPAFRGRLPVMIGDDTTDEDAFLAVQALGGFAIKVGEGDTAAAWRLDSPKDVSDWIRRQRQG